MRDYLSIWRLLPRTTIGLAFALLVVLAIGGREGVLGAAQAGQQFYRGIQSEITALVITILLLAVISTLSSQLIRTLGSACGFVARKVITLFSKKLAPPSLLIDLVDPLSSIVKRMYESNVDFYMKHYVLKSVADEKLEQFTAITTYYVSVREHTDAMRDWDVVCAQAYQESLSQDQRKIENMEEELSVERSMLVILFVAFPVMLCQMWIFGFALPVICGVISLLLAFAAVPSYVDRKRSLARFLLATYLDVFTVAEFSEYAEREGEPKLG